MRIAASFALGVVSMALAASPSSFTIDQILSVPAPDNLVASPSGATIAWTFNERGVRNIYAADAPAFVPRRLTSYAADDGQELTQLSISADRSRSDATMMCCTPAAS